MKNWELWIQRNKQHFKHPANLKEQFVRQILSKIDDISPEDLSATHRFTDSKGVERSIDILVSNPDKHQRLAIELDGLAPYKSADGDIDYRRFNEYLEQQNALNAAFPAILRYGAAKMQHAPDVIMSEIGDILRAQTQGDYTPKNKKEDNAAIIEAYQDDILALKKLWAAEARSLKENADRLVAQAAGKGRNDAQLHMQIRTLDAHIRTYEEKIRQYQRASLAAVIANEIDIKALIADIQTLKDIMSDIHHGAAGDDFHTGGQAKKTAVSLLPAVAAILALAAIAAGGYYYAGKMAKKNVTAQAVDPSAVLTELPVIEPPGSTDGRAASPAASGRDTGTAALPALSTGSIAAASPPPAPVETNHPPPQQAKQETHGDDGSIAAREAGQHIGETRRVCGRVAALKETKKSISLYFEAAPPKQSFTAVVGKTSKALARQASQLAHADVCVSGKIEENRKNPQMTISDSSQISFND